MLGTQHWRRSVFSLFHHRYPKQAGTPKLMPEPDTLSHHGCLLAFPPVVGHQGEQGRGQARSMMLLPPASHLSTAAVGRPVIPTARKPQWVDRRLNWWKPSNQWTYLQVHINSCSRATQRAEGRRQSLTPSNDSATGSGAGRGVSKKSNT